MIGEEASTIFQPWASFLDLQVRHLLYSPLPCVCYLSPSLLLTQVPGYKCILAKTTKCTITAVQNMIQALCCVLSVISSEILVPNLAAVNLISADIATTDSQILLKLTIIIIIIISIFFFILHHFLLVLHRPLSFDVLKDPKTKPLWYETLFLSPSCLVGSAKRLQYVPTTHLPVTIGVFFFNFC